MDRVIKAAEEDKDLSNARVVSPRDPVDKLVATNPQDPVDPVDNADKMDRVGNNQVGNVHKETRVDRANRVVAINPEDPVDNGPIIQIEISKDQTILIAINSGPIIPTRERRISKYLY